MKTFLLSLFLLIAIHASAQMITIRGRVTHALDGVSYAAIFVDKLSLGVAADEDGYFQLRIRQSDLPVRAVVSSLGYKSLTIDLNKVETLKVIELELDVHVLPEVVVKARFDSARFILKNMLKRLSKNYPTKTYQMNAFYTEAVRQGHRTVKTTDAYIHVQDKGYHRAIEQPGSVQFKVEHLRVVGKGPVVGWLESISNWFYGKNGFYLAVKDEPLRKKEIFNWFENVGGISGTGGQQNVEQPGVRSFLASRDFQDGYEFRLDSTGVVDGEQVYFLSFSNPLKTALSFGEGQLVVKKADYALLEFRARLVKTDRQDPTNWNLYQTFQGNLLFDLHVRYRKFNGKYYLSYLSSRSMGSNSGFLTRDFDKKRVQDGVVYIFKQVLVRDIQTKDFSLFRSKDTYPIDEEIADADVKCDVDFWNLQQVIPKR